MKRDVFKLHLSLNAGKHFGNFRLSDGRLFSINLTDFPVTAHGRGKVVGEPAQHFHGPYDIHGIFHEGAQAADGEPAVDNKASAEEQYDER